MRGSNRFLFGTTSPDGDAQMHTRWRNTRRGVSIPKTNQADESWFMPRGPDLPLMFFMPLVPAEKNMGHQSGCRKGVKTPLPAFTPSLEKDTGRRGCLIRASPAALEGLSFPTGPRGAVSVPPSPARIPPEMLSIEPGRAPKALKVLNTMETLHSLRKD